MNAYPVFGGLLATCLSFPSLRSLPGVAAGDWTLTRATEPSARDEGELLGRDRVADGVEVTLVRRGAGYRLRYDDTGVFDVSADGTALTWFPGPDPSADKVEADVLGRVLAVAMHAAGRLCLHASAVALAGGALAFVGPKHAGKSTLAMALVRSGGRLLGDDSLAVELGSRVRAYPGVHGVRLWGDSLNGLGRGAAGEVVDGKHVVTDLGPEQLEHRPRDLQAVYLLATRPPGPDEGAIERRRLTGVAATVALVRDGKVSALLGGTEAPRVLGRAARLAARVPVYALSYARAYARLPDLAARLVAWADADAAAGRPGHPAP